MRGRVKNINEQKEFGFIIGEDAKEYFFHFSNVLSVDLPTRNAIVDFEPQHNEKGMSAKDIKVMQKKSKMIVVGGDRINPDEIVSYGMDYGSFNSLDARAICEFSHYVWVNTYKGPGLEIRASEDECKQMLKVIDEALGVK